MKHAVMFTPRRLQALADGIDRHSNNWITTVVNGKIRVDNVADPCWGGGAEEYAQVFSRITGLPYDINWETGEIFLG